LMKTSAPKSAIGTTSGDGARAHSGGLNPRCVFPFVPADHGMGIRAWPGTVDRRIRFFTAGAENGSMSHFC